MFTRLRLLAPAITLGIVAIVIGPELPNVARAAEGVRLHAPDWALWRDLSIQVQIHILAALAALAIGFVILALPKGRGLHKPLGWAWVAAMAATAVSSLFITGLNGGSYSIIHLLTGWTLIALPFGVATIRRREVQAHRRSMLGMYLGGLMIAGALSFLPGRFMWEFLLG